MRLLQLASPQNRPHHFQVLVPEPVKVVVHDGREVRVADDQLHLVSDFQVASLALEFQLTVLGTDVCDRRTGMSLHKRLREVGVLRLAAGVEHRRREVSGNHVADAQRPGERLAEASAAAADVEDARRALEHLIGRRIQERLKQEVAELGRSAAASADEAGMARVFAAKRDAMESDRQLADIDE